MSLDKQNSIPKPSNDLTSLCDKPSRYGRTTIIATRAIAESSGFVLSWRFLIGSFESLLLQKRDTRATFMCFISS